MIIFLSSIIHLVSVMEVQYIFFEAGTEFLNIM